jgi:pseudaminic acid synthase
MNGFSVSGRKIGEEAPVFICAEVSANHLQDFRIAVKTIKAIKQAGADAVKMQTYKPGSLTIDCARKEFRIRNTSLWDNKTLYELYSGAATPWEWQPKLKRLAEEMGLIWFSTPFDAESADFLESLAVPMYKIASFEITDIPFIRYVAAKGKPVVISTGIATEAEIRDALAACRSCNNRRIILLKCTSAYPAPLGEVNVRSIGYLRDKYRTLLGISDHTLSIAVPAVSTAFGACFVEKHFILSRKMGGADGAFSLEPDEFALMAQAARDAQTALGNRRYRLGKAARASRYFARSLFVVEDMRRGEVFSTRTVRSIRPGCGLPPKSIDTVIGRRAAKAIARGTPLNRSLVQ